jgi:hypothetical protein
LSASARLSPRSSAPWMYSLRASMGNGCGSHRHAHRASPAAHGAASPPTSSNATKASAGYADAGAQPAPTT